jgi:large subunit ribosomal protein L17
MRHGDKVNNLGRTNSHRRAMMANMAISLITHKRINTTLAKAKALRRYFEPLVTKAKDNTTHSRRIVFSYLQNKDAVEELFGTVATKVGDRPGGYVRIIKLGFRRGDGADVAMIELVDFNEIYNAKGTANSNKKKTRRSRRSASAVAVAAPVAAAAVAEEPVVDTIEEVVEATVVDAVPVIEDVVADVAPEVTENNAPSAEAEETQEEA